jgi:hypothetical protein
LRLLAVHGCMCPTLCLSLRVYIPVDAAPVTTPRARHPCQSRLAVPSPGPAPQRADAATPRLYVHPARARVHPARARGLSLPGAGARALLQEREQTSAQRAARRRCAPSMVPAEHAKLFGRYAPCGCLQVQETGRQKRCLLFVCIAFCTLSICCARAAISGSNGHSPRHICRKRRGPSGPRTEPCCSPLPATGSD